MRKRFAVFLSVYALFASYTALKVAALLPSHAAAAGGAAVGALALLLAWQFVSRSGRLPAESPAVRSFSWIAAVGMGLWATFFLTAAVLDLAGLFLPASFRRRIPPQVPVAAALTFSTVTAALGLHEALKGPRAREVRVPVIGLPAALEGLRIVQISDLHVGPTIRRKSVERIVERTMALSPDLIAVTGDLADGPVARVGPHVEPLARLKAPLGVYFTTGNHEYYWDAPAWIAKAASLGFIPLLNEHRHALHRGATVSVGGVPDTSGGQFVEGHSPDVSRAAGPGAFRLLLSHRPDLAEQAEKAGFHLQLSGHTHGGQYFPWNLVISLFHRYARGLHHVGEMWLYVSPGTGYWGPPHRLGVPAEITALTLTAANR